MIPVARLLERYGDPVWVTGDYQIVPNPRWCAKYLRTWHLPPSWHDNLAGSSIMLHYHVLDKFLRGVERAKSVCDYRVKQLYGWSPRKIKGRQILSKHAFGYAFDVNWDTNKWGTTGDLPVELVRCFEDVGWVWGGRWKIPDPMHFEFGRIPETEKYSVTTNDICGVR